jgi:hypothetical protein
LGQYLGLAGERFEWEDIRRDLKVARLRRTRRTLQEMIIKDDGKVITVRSRAEGCCGKAFQAVGVALPPAVRTP